MIVDQAVDQVADLTVDLTKCLTTARGTDYYLLSELLTDAERKIRDRVRAFASLAKMYTAQKARSVCLEAGTSWAATDCCWSSTSPGT